MPRWFPSGRDYSGLAPSEEWHRSSALSAEKGLEAQSRAEQLIWAGEPRWPKQNIATVMIEGWRAAEESGDAFIHLAQESWLMIHWRRQVYLVFHKEPFSSSYFSDSSFWLSETSIFSLLFICRIVGCFFLGQRFSCIYLLLVLTLQKTMFSKKLPLFWYPLRNILVTSS